MKSELSRSDFVKSVCALAVPVALQSMLQSSFGAVDQIMIGQLGDVAVAGVGLAGKLASVCSVMLSAVGTVAGIMLSQYLGQENRAEVRRSFRVNLALSLLLALVFTLPCALAPRSLMRLYSTDERTVEAAATVTEPTLPPGAYCFSESYSPCRSVCLSFPFAGRTRASIRWTAECGS